MTAVAHGGLHSHTGGPCDGSIDLLTVVIATGKVAEVHNDAEASKCVLGWAVWCQLCFVHFETFVDRLWAMLCWCTCTHGGIIDGADACIRWSFRKLLESPHQLPAVLQTGWSEMDCLMQLVINPLGQEFWWCCCVVCNGPGFQWWVWFVDFGDCMKAWQLQIREWEDFAMLVPGWFWVESNEVVFE